MRRWRFTLVRTLKSKFKNSTCPDRNLTCLLKRYFKRNIARWSAPCGQLFIKDLIDVRVQKDLEPNNILICWLSGHGPQTGRCVPSERSLWVDYGVNTTTTVCEIQSWCPVEDDRLILGLSRPLISGSDKHTVYIKNSIRFSYFGDAYHRNNLPAGICNYVFDKPSSWLCNIFKLGTYPMIVILDLI